MPVHSTSRRAAERGVEITGVAVRTKGADRTPPGLLPRRGSRHNNTGGDKGTGRIVPLVLTLGLLFLGAGVTNGAAAEPCTGTDCLPEPLGAEFTALAEATVLHYPAGPVVEHLVRKVVLAQEALHPPNPAQPPVPIRSFSLLSSYQYEVQALAGTTEGATETDSAFLLGEAFDLQHAIVAAYPDLRFPPSAFHPPNPA